MNKETVSQITPVILSGGMGTRLWPLSRAYFPKQFCNLMNESLMEKTVKRVGLLGSPWVLTVGELKVLTEKLFRELGLEENQVILEPEGRNTAPAIALICRILEIQNRTNEIVGIFPADHLISKEDVFLKAVALAKTCAEQEKVVTLGLKPDYPATGFGYIETTQTQFASNNNLQAFSVAGFREKPDLKTAEQFVSKSNFFWNAGIFVFKVETMIHHLRSFTPEIWNGLQALQADLSNLKAIYSSLPKVSIDYGIMEKLKAELICIPCDIGWSDLGSWDDVARFSAPPFEMNFANHADVTQKNSSNCFVFSESKKVFGLLDVNDLIVVDTNDATLIAKKNSSQEVRQVFDVLYKRGDRTAREHLYEIRPWGNYTVLRDEAHYKSKLISIDPGAQISYQFHHKREENWIIVRGEGEVTIDGEIRKVGPGESVFIPIGAKHRIRNPGTENLEFIEVQTGSYFGEDDIVRIQDDYKRS